MCETALPQHLKHISIFRQIYRQANVFLYVLKMKRESLNQHSAVNHDACATVWYTILPM